MAGIPLIITSTRSMLAKLVPNEVQSFGKAVRMGVFEAAFIPAGFLVPLVTMNLTVFSIGLMLVSLVIVALAVREKNTYSVVNRISTGKVTLQKKIKNS